MKKMNIYYILGIICLVANAVLMLLASNKDQKEGEEKLLKNLTNLDSAQKESIFKKLDLSEFQIKTYLRDLDSSSRDNILKSLFPEFKKIHDEIGYSTEEVKQFYEKLDDDSRQKLFEQIKPEFDLVAGKITETEKNLSNKIKEGSDWYLSDEIKFGLISNFESSGLNKTKQKEIAVAHMPGNDASYKMAHYLVEYLIESGYNARVTGIQMIFNDYGIKFEIKNNIHYLWVGRKPPVED
jgi:hypothetical protein